MYTTSDNYGYTVYTDTTATDTIIGAEYNDNIKTNTTNVDTRTITNTSHCVYIKNTAPNHTKAHPRTQ